jgi:pyridoxal phosphate enzyme (YggS family)
VTRGEQIGAALTDVRRRIDDAAARAGRPIGQVRLIAVSKKMPPEDVLSALAAGQQDFGENYAQELRDKRAAVRGWAEEQATARDGPTKGSTGAAGAPTKARPRWHYLGPIQRNKVKYLAGQVALIQSLDDADILADIDRRVVAAGADVTQACLVQVNVAGETRKAGVPPHRLPEFLDRFAMTTRTTCIGLMLIPPLSADPDATRRHFAALRELAAREQTVSRPNVSLSELSMGMSSDFIEAIAEGATMVRVGTAIFGARDKP